MVFDQLLDLFYFSTYKPRKVIKLISKKSLEKCELPWEHQAITGKCALFRTTD